MDPEKQLEQIIHQKLRSLPPLPAPPGLVPGVLKAIHARAHAAWWRRPWLAWPIQFKLLSSIFFLGTLTAALLYRQQLFNQLTAAAHPVWQVIAPLFSTLQTLATAALLILASIKLSILLILTAVAVSAYLTTVGVGTLCYRIVASRT